MKYLLTIALVLLLAVNTSGVAPGSSLQQFQSDIAAAAAIIRPSVVSVKGVKMVGNAASPVKYESIGAGFIVDKNGYILTNEHVIRGTDSLKVKLWGNNIKEYPARVVFADMSRDLAVIKVNTMELLTPAVFAHEGSLEVGDYLLCVGSPFGFNHSLTMGIVSDLNRKLVINGVAFGGMIQTDAVINAGNSGGPVTDIYGRVVGMATAVLAPGGKSAGLGFAIPVKKMNTFIAGISGSLMPNPANAAGSAIPAALNTGPVGQNQPAFGVGIDVVVFKLIPLVLIAAILLSMIGTGGGFIYVPVLISCGLDFNTAAGTSLMMLTCAQFSSLYNYLKSGMVDLKLALVLEAPTMAGAFLGGLLAHYFNVTLLTFMFASMLFVSSFLMMQGHMLLEGRGYTGGLLVSPWKWRHRFRGNDITIDIMLTLPIVFLVGYLGGMLGFSGGWLKVPIMVLLLNVPMKIAIATSSCMILITGFSGFMGHYIAGYYNPGLAFILSLVAMTGSFIGSRLSVDTENSILRFSFSFILFAVGVWMLGRMI